MNACKTFRVCEVVINLIELLLDLGILNQSWHGDVPKVPTPSVHNSSAEYMVHLSYAKPMSVHALAMSCIIKQVSFKCAILFDQCRDYQNSIKSYKMQQGRGSDGPEVREASGCRILEKKLLNPRFMAKKNIS